MPGTVNTNIELFLSSTKYFLWRPWNSNPADVQGASLVSTPGRPGPHACMYSRMELDHLPSPYQGAALPVSYESVC
jgi:hypothetical protein